MHSGVLTNFSLHGCFGCFLLCLWDINRLHGLFNSADLLLIDLIYVRSKNHEHNSKNEQIPNNPTELSEVTSLGFLQLLLLEPAGHVIDSVSLAPNANHFVNCQNVGVTFAVVIQNRKRICLLNLLRHDLILDWFSVFCVGNELRQYQTARNPLLCFYKSVFDLDFGVNVDHPAHVQSSLENTGIDDTSYNIADFEQCERLKDANSVRDSDYLVLFV